MSIQHFVNFLSPGTFFNEETNEPIGEWDTKLATQMASKIKERHGATPYGFKFETRITHPPIPDGEGGKLEVVPKTIKTSGTYFLGGELETLDEIKKRKDPRDSILISNMEGNGWYIVCVNTNSYKSTMPFNKEDFLLDKKGGIVSSGNDKKFVEYRKNTGATLKAQRGY